MSSVFGLINKFTFSKGIENEITGLLSWNLPYGKYNHKVVQSSNYYIGCCQDRINQSIGISEPVISENNRIYAIDALIYNREELLKECTVSSTLSDEQLLITYITAKGLSALKNVNGDFSGAIYNSEKKELTLFRDHMGIRPLFYCIQDDFIAFSSDIRGLAGIQRANISLNEQWIYRSLMGYKTLGLEDTEYSDIFCVKPGTCLTLGFKDGKICQSSKTYWDLCKKKIKLKNDLQYQDKLNELITDSIKRRLDVVTGEVGAELSGGLDSGVISILIHKLGRKCFYFSWSDSPDVLPYSNDDERLIIKDICDQENITCNYRHFVPDLTIPLQNNYKICNVKTTDELSENDFVTPPYINTIKITETSLFMNHYGVKAIFTGHGGDEGVSHRADPFEMYYRHEYFDYIRYMYARLKGQPRRAIRTIKGIKNNIADGKKTLRYPFSTAINATGLISDSFSNDHKKENITKLYFNIDTKKYILTGGSRNRLDNVSLQGAFCDVRYMIPYLDYRVINYAVSIPRSQFLKPGQNRSIFREAFKDIMPNSLYRLVEKSTTSKKNLPHDPNWYDKYLSMKESAISKLDEKTWGKYIDFNKLKAFANKEKPTYEESLQDLRSITCLNNLINAQQTLKKTREISQKII